MKALISTGSIPVQTRAWSVVTRSAAAPNSSAISATRSSVSALNCPPGQVGPHRENAVALGTDSAGQVSRHRRGLGRPRPRLDPGGERPAPVGRKARARAIEGLGEKIDRHVRAEALDNRRQGFGPGRLRKALLQLNGSLDRARQQVLGYCVLRDPKRAQPDFVAWHAVLEVRVNGEIGRARAGMGRLAPDDANAQAMRHVLGRGMTQPELRQPVGQGRPVDHLLDADTA